MCNNILHYTDACITFPYTCTFITFATLICISSELTRRPLWGAKEERMHLENLSYILSLTGHCIKKYSEAKTKLLLG
jgi:hypothetical protein